MLGPPQAACGGLPRGVQLVQMPAESVYDAGSLCFSVFSVISQQANFPGWVEGCPAGRAGGHVLGADPVSARDKGRRCDGLRERRGGLVRGLDPPDDGDPVDGGQ